MSLTTSGDKIIRNGKEFIIRTLNVSANDTTRVDGGQGNANNLDESWFKEADVLGMKNLGYNAIDMHMLGVWRVSNGDGSINTGFFENFIDKMVEYCAKYEMYVIINYQRFNPHSTGFNSYGWYYVPSWFWEYGEGKPKPITFQGVSRVCIDFYKYSVPKMNGAREYYLRLLEFTANRYKDNPYVLISPRNEPQHFIYKHVTGEPEAQEIVDGYYQLHTIAVDRMRATGFNGIISIEVPYGMSQYGGRQNHIQNIDRPNIIYEYHTYMKPDGSKPFSEWSGKIQEAIDGTYAYNKPFYLGEYHIDPTKDDGALISDSMLSTVTKQQFDFVDDRKISDNVHCWGRFYGWTTWKGTGWTDHQTDIFMALQADRIPLPNGGNGGTEMSFEYKNEDATDLTVYKRKIVIQDTPIVIPAGGSVTITLDPDEILVQK